MYVLTLFSDGKNSVSCCCRLQIWVNSGHNANGYFSAYGEQSLHRDHFEAHLATGDIHTTYARTGYLGFIRRTEKTQSDGGRLVDVW